MERKIIDSDLGKHYKAYMNKTYLGCHDIEDGVDLIATVTKAQMEEIVGDRGRKEVKLVVEFEGAKPLIMNATNSERLAKLADSPKPSEWAGTVVQFRCEKLDRKMNGQTHGIRIAPFSPHLVVAINKATSKEDLKAIQEANRTAILANKSILQLLKRKASELS